MILTCMTKDIKKTYKLNWVLLLNVLESIQLGFFSKMSICVSYFSVAISSCYCGLSPVFTLLLYLFVHHLSNLCLGEATLVFI